jgi:predicted patatin/cPLA2 family phospholipase
MRALVIAGGGMRGAYGSGAVNAMDEMGLRFDAVYGTSVGGAIAAWFTAGQAADGLRTWKYARDPRVLNYGRWLTRRGPLMDLGYLYNHVYLEEVGLEPQRIARAKHAAFVIAVDADSAQTHALDLRQVHVPTALHATSAIPIVAEGPVRLDGHAFWDGGVNEPVPLARAIRDGARDVTLVLNHEATVRPGAPLAAVWWMRRKYPALVDSIRSHGRFYEEAERLAEDPPDGVNVRTIRPQAPTGLNRFSRDLTRIDRAIARGRDEAYGALA